MNSYRDKDQATDTINRDGRTLEENTTINKKLFRAEEQAIEKATIASQTIPQV